MPPDHLLEPTRTGAALAAPLKSLRARELPVVGVLATGGTIAGIVVTHGTSTLEETGYFLNLTVKVDRAAADAERRDGQECGRIEA
jgi:L-asparaginase/Glu-tRNA(Gln) amidotransferase subunit D